MKRGCDACRYCFMCIMQHKQHDVTESITAASLISGLIYSSIRQTLNDWILLPTYRHGDILPEFTFFLPRWEHAHKLSSGLDAVAMQYYKTLFHTVPNKLPFMHILRWLWGRILDDIDCHLRVVEELPLSNGLSFTPVKNEFPFNSQISCFSISLLHLLSAFLSFYYMS